MSLRPTQTAGGTSNASAGDLVFACDVNLGFPLVIRSGPPSSAITAGAPSVRRCSELDWQYHVSSAASNALAIAGLLLPARTASPMAMTVCPGLANDLKRSAVPTRAL